MVAGAEPQTGRDRGERRDVRRNCRLSRDRPPGMPKIVTRLRNGAKPPRRQPLRFVFRPQILHTVQQLLMSQT
jgi:hypothetical protein